MILPCGCHVQILQKARIYLIICYWHSRLAMGLNKLHVVRHAHIQVNCADQRLCDQQECNNPECRLDKTRQLLLLRPRLGLFRAHALCNLIAVGKKRDSLNLWEVTLHSSLLHRLAKMVFNLAHDVSSPRRPNKTGEALNRRGALQSVSLKEGFSVGIAHTLFHCAQAGISRCCRGCVLALLAGRWHHSMAGAWMRDVMCTRLCTLCVSRWEIVTSKKMDWLCVCTVAAPPQVCASPKLQRQTLSQT